MEIDPQYASDKVRHFSFYKIRHHEDFDTKKKVLRLEADIIESDMHRSEEKPEDQRPVAKKFFKRLKLYSDSQFTKVFFEMELSTSKLNPQIDIPRITPIKDGYVLSSIEIDLPDRVGDLIKKHKFDAIWAVFLDGKGKVVSLAQVNADELLSEK